ncbi:hypothetical protein GCM10022236_52640 [Microlunatus ginsengisoli]|uniref:Uncharacterized protein n=1 Tax=Microlunatus ginsengisoli TaxID=363863 RepID=A0ABP7AZP6_9ACTN
MDLVKVIAEPVRRVDLRERLDHPTGPGEYDATLLPRRPPRLRSDGAANGRKRTVPVNEDKLERHG